MKLIALLLSLFTVPTLGATIPELGVKLRITLKKELKATWGLWGSDYLAVSAAQIHQESAWNPEAQSPYAQGLTQFTPSTGKWIAEKYRDELWPFDPWDTSWAIKAMVLYDRDLYRSTRAADGCERWAMTLAKYNGGGIKADKRAAAMAGHDPDRWFNNVELFNGRKRRASAFKENRGYPRRILLTLTPRYYAAGYGGRLICD